MTKQPDQAIYNQATSYLNVVISKRFIDQPRSKVLEGARDEHRKGIYPVRISHRACLISEVNEASDPGLSQTDILSRYTSQSHASYPSTALANTKRTQNSFLGPAKIRSIQHQLHLRNTTQSTGLS
jgi:hypothetical protein